MNSRRLCFYSYFCVFFSLFDCILFPNSNYLISEKSKLHPMRVRSTILAQSLARDWSGRTHQNPRFTRLLSTTPRHASRHRTRLEIPPPFPVTKKCPESACDCPTPTLPEGLPIDHEHPLNGTMVAYAQQLVVCTGQRDWMSRIEDDGESTGWGNLVRGLKRLLGRGGPYLDVCGSLSPQD